MNEDMKQKVGRVRTCAKEEVESLTSQGWILREIHEEQHFERGGSYQDYNSNGFSFTRQHPDLVVSKLVFVLEYSRDQELLDLRAALGVSQAEKRSAVERAASSEKSVKDVERRAATLSEALKVSNDLAARRESERSAAEVLKRRLEEDLAKVRREIGEARFREIVGG